MRACEIPKEESLFTPVHLKLEGRELDFQRAERAAINLARAYYTEPVVLSWYDGKKGIFSPGDVERCVEGKPGWVDYAKSRGGNLTIDINDEEYVFIFQGKPNLS